jgi:hypothetical protein
MPRVNDVIAAIRRNSSPLEVIVDLKIKPSRLMQIIQTRRFRQQIAMEAQLAKAIVHYRTATNAGWAMTALAGLMVDKKEETIRKSCVTILDHLVSGKLTSKRLKKSRPAAIAKGQKASR